MSKKGEDNLSWELWQELTTTTENLEKNHSRRISQYKLTNPQFNVLKTLNSEGKVSLRNISNKLNVTGANITCVMDNLEKRKLAKRVPSKKDRRVIKAELTQEGKRTFEQITPLYFDSIQKETEKLSDEEKMQLIQLLSKLKN